MTKPPESYLDSKRPPLHEAIEMEGEGCETLDQVLEVLTRKGYFTPPPRPWSLGFKIRGMGRGDFAVLDRFGDLVVETLNKETAEFIIEVINGHLPTNTT